MIARQLSTNAAISSIIVAHGEPRKIGEIVAGVKAISPVQMNYLRSAIVSDHKIKLIAILQLIVKATELTSFA